MKGSSILTIAGWDPSAGAGVLRDLTTIAESGGDGHAAITAVTAQTDKALMSIDPVSPVTVRDQIDAAFATADIVAVKIGMLANAEIAEAVADALRSHARLPVVLDPVLMSSSGKVLLDEAGCRVLWDQLLPLTRVVTPNLPEAEALTGLKDHAAQAAAFFAKGAGAVLIKGGHATGENSIDHLYQADLPLETFSAPRHRASLRGTGCALSSAMAVALGNGLPLSQACAAGKAYIKQRFSKA